MSLSPVASARGTRRSRNSRSAAAMLRSPLVLVVMVVVSWFVVALLVLPNLNMLAVTFFPDGQFSWSAVERLSRSTRAMRALGNSFLLAVLLSITTNVVGVFIVLATRFFDLRGARVLWLGYATTFIYGGIVLAAAYKLIYGSEGVVGRLLAAVVPGLPADWFTGLPAVLFTMTLATTTNHLLFVSASVSGLDGQMLEAARMMGASTWTVLRRIVLPMMRPVLFATTILSFLTGLGALSAPQVLGGRDFQTIAPMILTFSNSATSRDIAALLALVLGLATIVLLVVLTRLERSGTYFSIAKVSTTLVKQRITHPVGNAVVHVVAWGLWVLYVLPVALIVAGSFMPPEVVGAGELDFGALTLENYARVLTQNDALRPFVVSIVYSALAAVVVVFGMLLVSWIATRYRNWLTETMEYLLHIPWILPSTMIALGLIMTYDHATWLMGRVVLTGTPIILFLAYVIVKTPFTLRMLKASFASINGSLEEAASLMGAGKLTILRRILLPAVLPAAAAVTALNFNGLLDDYDMAVFLAHPLYQPLGLVIQTSTSGDVGPEATSNVFVYTVLLMVITGVTMWLVYGGAGSRRRRKLHLPEESTK